MKDHDCVNSFVNNGSTTVEGETIKVEGRCGKCDIPMVLLYDYAAAYDQENERYIEK